MTRSKSSRILTPLAVRARLTCGVSIAAMVGALGAGPAAAQTIAGLHGAIGPGGIPAAATAALTGSTFSNPVNAAMAAAQARSMRNQAQLTQTVTMAQQAQAAARAAAAALNHGVPDGLILGGLQVAPNVTTAANDPTGLHTWDGAALPTVDSKNPNQIDIVQNKSQAVLDWTTFNVGQKTTVDFIQQQNGVGQPSWIAVNRVVGQLMPNGLRNPSLAPAPSQIFGSIKADGTVIVINQNGVIFGATSQVNVNSLVATSLELGYDLKFVNGTGALASLSDRDNEFLSLGLLGYSDQNGQGGGLYTFSAQATGITTTGTQYDPLLEGEVQVQQGASINSASSGYIVLAAPRVVNGGALSSPEGQISLVSGRAVTFTRSEGTTTSIDPNLRGLQISTVSLGGATGDYVDNLANATLDAPQGYISLQATPVGAVIDGGVLTSTTAVSRNGYINIQAGNIQFDPAAVLAITPDSSAASIPQDPNTLADFKTSVIRIGDTGSAIDIGANSLIYAPSARITIGADPGQTTLTNAETPTAGRVFIDSGAVIDASGVQNVLVSATANAIKIDPVTQNSLQDTPTYRSSFLNGAIVYVDPRLSGVNSNGVAWIGSPLIPAASYYQQVGVSASELMTTGGNVTIGAPSTAPGTGATQIPDVVIKSGASIDISGGWRTFQAGIVQTTQLVDANGEVVNIGYANPNDTYVGVYNGFTTTQSRWGVSQTFANPLFTGAHMEGQYTEGRDAGTLNIKSSVVVLDGQVIAQAFPGAEQILDSQQGTAKGTIYGDIRNLQGAPSQLPSGGYLDIQALGVDSQGNFTGGGDIDVTDTAGYAPVSTDLTYGQTASLAADGSLIIPQRPLTSVLPVGRLNVISLNADAISSMGLSQLTLETSGSITVEAGASVTLNAGGAFEAVAGRSLTVNGQITAPAGSIDLRTADILDSSGLGGSVLNPTIAGPGSFDITVNGQLNVAGRWANDYNASADQLAGSAYLNGGEITLLTAPRVAPLDTSVSADNSAALTQSTDISGSILVNKGGILNVTGGGYVAPNGNLTLTARGGSVSLYDEDNFFPFSNDFTNVTTGSLPGSYSGFRVTTIINATGGTGVVAVNPSAVTGHISIADGSILAHGFGGGGTFNLTAPSFTFGDSVTSTGAALPLDFFSKTGFANYNIKSYATDLIPNAFTNGLGGYNAVLATQVVTVGAGQTLSLSESMFSPLLSDSQTAMLRGFATGGDLNTVLTPIIPTDAWDARPVNLSLGGMIELDVAQGGAIQGQAGGVLTVSQLWNQGTIHIPGGAIVQSEGLPTLYASSSQVTSGEALNLTGQYVIAAHSLSDVFSTAADGSISESDANVLGLTDLNGNVLTNGQVAGNVSIYLLGNLKANEGVRLSAGSVTDLSGEAIVNPRAVPSGGAPVAGFVNGVVINGGSLRTSGASGASTASPIFHSVLGVSPYFDDSQPVVLKADIVAAVLNAEANSAIDLQGASATFDRPFTQTSNLSGAPAIGYAPTQVWSNGGSLTLGSGGAIAGAIIQAQGGATSAEGGTLTVLNPVLTQSDPANPQPGAYTVDTAQISADAITRSGFDTFVAQGALNTLGDVTLNLRGAFFLTSRPQDGGLDPSSASSRDLYSPTIGSGGALTINAAYVGLAGGFQSFSTPAYGTVGDNSVTFNAQAIGVTGAVLFDRSVGQVNLNSTGDLQLVGVEPWQLVYNITTSTPTTPSLAGQLAVNGNLTITAGQVYPTTGTNFTISSASATGVITFEKAAGATPATPYSAGGKLNVQATTIVQDGVLRAPLGTITLGSSSTSVFAPVATQNLTLGSGSITSVSTDGLVIPYGTTTDQIEWFFNPTNNNPLTAPPAAVLQLAGANVNVASGATVDLKGGGDIYAYEFISGIGGSRDVLSQFNSDAFSSNNGYQYPDGRQVYAIVPSLANAAVAPFDPIYSANYSSLYGPGQVGERVYLNAAPGLAAGWYTLLPAQYAMLPGGMRVVQDTGAATPPPNSSSTLLDGTDVVSGYFGQGPAGAYQATPVVFDVQSQSVFRTYSQIALTYGNKTFAADAAKSGVTTPRLPIDSGRLILAPVSSLLINGAFDTTPATGGRGSEVDISGTSLDIVSAGGGSGAPGSIVLTTASLSDLNAASLFLGGVRTDNADGTTSLDVTTNKITVESGATISAPEVLLATDGSGATLTVTDGASIVASGSVSDPSTGDYLIVGGASPAQSAQGGFLRVANGPQRLLVRSGIQSSVAPGAVTLGNATLQGTSVEAESSGNLLISPDTRLDATNLALGASTVTFASSSTGLTGLVITPTLQSQISQARELTIQSSNALEFQSGTYGFGNLTLDAPGLANAQGGTVAINAGVLTLANSSGVSPLCGASGAPACGAGTLDISASQVVFSGGSVTTYGFDTAANITASQGMVVDGVGGLNFGLANVALNTPFIGDRGTGLPGATLPKLTLISTGNIDITAPTGSSGFIAPAGTPGSSVSISGNQVTVSGATIRATAGNLKVQGATGVVVTNGGTLATPGYLKTFGDSLNPTTVSAPAGTLTLVAVSGDINVNGSSVLSIYGAQGPAGTLSLSAPTGNVLVSPSNINAGPAGSGASLTLDTGGSFDLTSFATGAGSPFTGQLSITTGQGNLDLAAGDTLKATDVTLVANAGSVSLEGTINVSGTVGGDVSLYGVNGVHLASGSLINATANGYGATDSRQASGGNVTIGVSGSGVIAVDSGAVINVGLSSSDSNNVNRLVPIYGSSAYNYVAADQGGAVTFRAPVIQQAGGDTVNVNYNGAVNGAGSIVLEGYQQWNLASVAANSAYTGVQIINGQAVLDLSATGAGQVNFLAGNGPGTLVNFIQNFNISSAYAGLHGLASQANFHARPGVELDYSGDIVLNSNWNLGAGVVDVAGATAAGLMAPVPGQSGEYYVLPGDEAAVFANFTRLTYRVGGAVTGEPGDLTLRAGGNLDVNGSITDGFFEFQDQTNPNYLNTAMGGGNRTYQGYLTPGCLTGSCSGVDQWSVNDNPNNAVLFEFPGQSSLSSYLANPIPYSAAGNAPDALGSLPGGQGDALGSAQLFPLLPGVGGKAPAVVNSWTYQLVGGAAPGVDPMSTQAGSTASVTVAGENVYGFQATAGSVSYADTLGLALANSAVPTSVQQWYQAFLAQNKTAGLNQNSYTVVDFSAAPPSVQRELNNLVNSFFQNISLNNYINYGTGVETTLSLATKFMSYVASNFGQLAQDYRPPREVISTQTTYATAPTLVRTGTGNIEIAAAGQIDLSNGAQATTLNRKGQIVLAQPGQVQLGGAAIYTAGHQANLGVQSAVDVATGQTVQVNLAANLITPDNTDTTQPGSYQYGEVLQGSPSGYAGILIANPVYAQGGGSISLAAGGDILGRRDTQLEGELGGVGGNNVQQPYSWIGSGAQPWRTGAIGSFTYALINPQLFKEGLGTLAGGDISVTAAGNLTDLSVVATTALTTGTASGSSLQPSQALVTLGGGNIAVRADNILAGRFDDASGQVNISAQGNIESDGLVTLSSATTPVENLLRLRLTDATVTINALGSASLQGIAALGVGVSDQSQNQANLNAEGFYSSRASVSIVADGAVGIANAGEDVLTTNSNGTANTQSAVYPGSLQAVSLTDGLNITTSNTAYNVAAATLLYPSPTGTLRLLADGDIAPLTIAMEDASPNLLPGAYTSFTTLGGIGSVASGLTFNFPTILPDTTDVTRQELHNPESTHAGDQTPNEIMAGGSITDLIFSSPKQARITAGLDLINTIFIGQNLAATDVTRIYAGRDIFGTTTLVTPVTGVGSNGIVFGSELPAVQGNTFVIGGPGAFFLEAGRDAGPFLNSAVTNGFQSVNGTFVPTGPLTFAGGVQSVGNLYNPWLSQQGASIFTAFGVGKGQNFSGLIDYYLNPTNFSSLPGYLFTQTTTATGQSAPNRDQEIYSLDLLTWLQTIAPTVISQYNQEVAASPTPVTPSALVQVAQALEKGQTVSLSQAIAVLSAVADQRLPLIPWLQLNYPSLLIAQFGTLNVTYQQAYNAFLIVPTLNQQQYLLKDVYFNELIQTSVPSSPSYLQYVRGYQAVNTLFPASDGYTLNNIGGGSNGSNSPVLTGNLDLRLSTIQTDQGGDVIILGPGGEVLAGSTVATSVQAQRRDYEGGALYAGNPSTNSSPYIEASTISQIPVGYEGILTLQGGAIDGFTDGNFLLNQSRLFTENGGDIALWSSNANLNAGQGPKTSANFPPIAVTIDENAYSTIDAAAGVSGAGIAAFQPDPATPAPDVFLIAPRGTVDAGAAGVRSAGSIFVAALQVANSSNFTVTGSGGSISGVGSGAVVNVSAGTSASAASAAASQAAQAASNNASGGTDRTVITVDVLGYLAGLSDTCDEDEKKKGRCD